MTESTKSSLYFAADWVLDLILLNETNFGAVLAYAEQNGYQLKLLHKGSNAHGQQFWRIGLHVTDEAERDNFTAFVQAEHGIPLEWEASTAEEYEAGNRQLTQVPRPDALGALLALRTVNKASYDLQKKLNGPWQYHEVIYCDWVIDALHINKVGKLFDEATELGIELVYVFLTDANGYKLMRFIAIVPVMYTFESYRHQTAARLGLEEWEQLPPENRPNLYGFFPSGSKTVWNSTLLESALHNKRLQSGE